MITIPIVPFNPDEWSPGDKLVCRTHIFSAVVDTKMRGPVFGEQVTLKGHMDIVGFIMIELEEYNTQEGSNVRLYYDPQNFEKIDREFTDKLISQI